MKAMGYIYYIQSQNCLYLVKLVIETNLEESIKQTKPKVEVAIKGHTVLPF